MQPHRLQVHMSCRPWRSAPHGPARLVRITYVWICRHICRICIHTWVRPVVVSPEFCPFTHAITVALTQMLFWKSATDHDNDSLLHYSVELLV